MKKKSNFKNCQAVVWIPEWLKRFPIKNHPLKFGEVVYFLGEISNCSGHCIVVKFNGQVIPMLHTADFRLAKENEL